MDIEEFDSFHDAIVAMDKTMPSEDIAEYIDGSINTFIEVLSGVDVARVDKMDDHISIHFNMSEQEVPIAKYFGVLEDELTHQHTMSDHNETSDRHYLDKYVFKIDDQPIVIIENLEKPKCDEWSGETLNSREYYHGEIHYFSAEGEAISFFNDKVSKNALSRMDGIIRKFESDWEAITENCSLEQQTELFRKFLDSDFLKPVIANMESKHLETLIGNDQNQSQSMKF